MEHFLLHLLKSAGGRAVAAVVAMVVGAALFQNGYDNWQHADRLRRGARLVQAEVTGSRARRLLFFRVFELRYRFRTDGQKPWHVNRDNGALLAGDWSLVDEPQWERAVAGGVVAVAYLPADPDFNCPESVAASPLGGSRKFMIAGGAVCAIGALSFGPLTRRWRAKRRAARAAVAAEHFLNARSGSSPMR